MWYRIDSINHPMFQNFYNYDKVWCDKLRREKSSASYWDKYLNKENPIEIYYYEDSQFKIIWMIKYAEYLDAWFVITLSAEFNEGADPEDYFHILAQIVVDGFTNKGHKKYIRQDMQSDDYIPQGFDAEKLALVDIIKNDWYRKYYDNGRGIEIWESYGIKTVRYIDSNGLPMTSYEMM